MAHLKKNLREYEDNLPFLPEEILISLGEFLDMAGSRESPLDQDDLNKIIAASNQEDVENKVEEHTADQHCWTLLTHQIEIHNTAWTTDEDSLVKRSRWLGPFRQKD
ncbi:hypothetical protein BCON_0068g00390 [Botryotinia convoluta]|uniref:Uncharacterized protein n=1 Tax=Botryotinia convoluta TaxID=54673 RepID=A0A4Z1I6K6_9HELO|nr:hypothetical protein BCON_0068g00390 [Botryotinia convoluta]